MPPPPWAAWLKAMVLESMATVPLRLKIAAAEALTVLAGTADAAVPPPAPPTAALPDNVEFAGSADPGG